MYIEIDESKDRILLEYSYYSWNNLLRRLNFIDQTTTNHRKFHYNYEINNFLKGIHAGGLFQESLAESKKEYEEGENRMKIIREFQNNALKWLREFEESIYKSLEEIFDEKLTEKERELFLRVFNFHNKDRFKEFKKELIKYVYYKASTNPKSGKSGRY